MVASRLARVPVRIHTFTGQVWVNLKGPKRLFLKTLDRVIARMASHILVDSPSQRDFLLDQKVIHKARSACLGEGSISGVDLSKFAPDMDVRDRVRKELQISVDQVMVVFIGRLKRDKGVLDLAKAIGRRSDNHILLLLVGPDEEDLEEEIMGVSGINMSRVKFISFTPNPELYIKASDILCLPSYREGFGSVVIEAAACAVPAIGTRIYGITDSIQDGRTGLLYEKGDISTLGTLLDKLACDKDLRTALGNNARERTEKVFSQDRLTSELMSLYGKLID